MTLIPEEASDEEYQRAKVRMGNEFKNWLENDETGRYISIKLEEAELGALRELSISDPTDTTRIIQLQERARAFGAFRTWLETVFTEAVVAEHQLRQLESEESGY